MSGVTYSCPFVPAKDLTEADVDPLMWPILREINASGWVETSASCEGHEGERGWEPFITFCLEEARGGQFLRCLSKAMIVPPPPTSIMQDGRRVWENATFGTEALMGIFERLDGDGLYVKVRCLASNEEERDKGLTFFRHLARFIAEVPNRDCGDECTCENCR